MPAGRWAVIVAPSMASEKNSEAFRGKTMAGIPPGSLTLIIVETVES